MACDACDAFQGQLINTDKRTRQEFGDIGSPRSAPDPRDRSPRRTSEPHTRLISLPVWGQGLPESELGVALGVGEWPGHEGWEVTVLKDCRLRVPASHLVTACSSVPLSSLSLPRRRTDGDDEEDAKDPVSDFCADDTVDREYFRCVALNTVQITTSSTRFLFFFDKATTQV